MILKLKLFIFGHFDINTIKYYKKLFYNNVDNPLSVKDVAKLNRFIKKEYKKIRCDLFSNWWCK